MMRQVADDGKLNVSGNTICLVKELGGKMTDWNGKKLGISSDGKIIASNFSNHHKKVMDLLKKIKK